MAIPTTESIEAETNEDNQTAVRLVIYEGEQCDIRQNDILGSFFLHGITASAKGIFSSNFLYFYLDFYSFSLVFPSLMYVSKLF